VRSGCGTPIAARSGPRRKTSNETSALTGLPGSVMIGVPVPATRPAPWGMPGCIATFTNSTSPPSESLTTS
jgi:hypothetical protein